MIIFYLFSLAICVIWVYMLVYLNYTMNSLPVLKKQVKPANYDDAELAMVSIIIPACNEEEHLEESLLSRLNQDYPRFELIVINDRSTDGTKAIIDRIAAMDGRLRPIDITELPNGWLGKVHALHQGVKLAKGEWYLFSDADITFKPDMLRSAVYYAQSQQVQHLTCLPEAELYNDFWLDVTCIGFLLLFCNAARIPDINENKGNNAIGIGAFNLVEAKVFNQTKGFEWLKMEPADDMGVGYMLKQHGAKSRVADGLGLIKFAWYENLSQAFSGLEKNTFGPGSQYSYFKQIGIVLFLLAMGLLPSVALALGMLSGDVILMGIGSLAWLTNIIVAFVVPKESNKEIPFYLLLPIGILLIATIMANAAWKCFQNRGVYWRGTLYPVEQLRAGQRVKL
ncbi:glycosyltransferase [Crenothrix polyspora]|uniref:Putative Glycosyltransferases, probably involved in cell wall biogenesis n=1 Tax=Crenothrix polyspora TaxID=360316 RepID=A0A1R4H3Z2_9GAMM|nr:glycosyltransferase family 2 protein [Crenothrix polyspora]SJM90939.1 putative Glycosyltransferases, probably involved in cell wall biogenesis [Crenothrix polyspora]